MRKRYFSIIAILLFALVFSLALAACEQNENGGADIAVTKITLDLKNARTTYFSGEVPSADGALVTAEYSDGTTKSLFPNECEVSVTENASSGTATVKVTYQGKSASYVVSLVKVKGLSLDTSNVKKIFALDENFVYDGLKVYAEYEGGAERVEVSEKEYTIEYPSTATYGEHIVTVRHGGKSTWYPIRVLSVNVNSVDLLTENGRLKIKIDGNFGGYYGGNLAVDVESTETWQRSFPASEYTIDDAWNFTVKADVSEIALSAKPYFFHVAHDDKYYDIPTSVITEKSVEFGGATYTLSLKKVFDNNENLFPVLIAGGEESAKGEVSVAGISVASSANKAILTVTGTYLGGYKASDFKLRSEQYNVWQKTYFDDLSVTLDSGMYTLTVDVTALSKDSGGKHYFHISFDGGNSWVDIADIVGFTASAATVGGKTYSMNQEIIWSSGAKTCILTVAGE